METSNYIFSGSVRARENFKLTRSSIGSDKKISTFLFVGPVHMKFLPPSAFFPSVGGILHSRLVFDAIGAVPGKLLNVPIHEGPPGYILDDTLQWVIALMNIMASFSNFFTVCNRIVHLPAIIHQVFLKCQGVCVCSNSSSIFVVIPFCGLNLFSYAFIETIGCHLFLRKLDVDDGFLECSSNNCYQIVSIVFES